MSIRSLRFTGTRLAVLGSVLAVGATVVCAQDKDLSMGNVNPPKHGTSQASQQFADKLAEITGGKTKIAHHHSGTLGGEREVAQQIQLGAVDFGPITTAPLSTLVPEMSVFQLPYIFRDYDHVFKALDGSDTLDQVLRGRARQDAASSSSASSPPATAASTATARSTRWPTSRARRCACRRTRSWSPPSRRSA